MYEEGASLDTLDDILAADEVITQDNNEHDNENEEEIHSNSLARNKSRENNAMTSSSSGYSSNRVPLPQFITATNMGKCI